MKLNVKCKNKLIKSINYHFIIYSIPKKYLLSKAELA